MARSSGKTAKARQVRAHGEESRQRILDAAAEIAGERGYDGTSIALVSERSGLPASSIYWHFQDKDRLLAAVIERSFARWLDGMSAWLRPRAEQSRLEHLRLGLRTTAKALLDSPEFLRLGLMLALERRPAEASARTRFLEVRARTMERLVAAFAAQFPELDARGAHSLATLTMAAADGLFIAHELDPGLDLGAHFELVAAGLLATADELARRAPRSGPSTRSRKGRAE
ncbi:MAG TPA: helix-turn-helix domain-containing protein [Myxococcota bacterium]|nr:helix-turn-helix domain-containing protein [Myxococcota bacterium]